MKTALLFASALAAPAIMSWEDWLEEFGHAPNLLSATKDLALRRQHFEENIQKIKEHNAKGLSWTMGVNQFADLTPDEFVTVSGTSMCSHSGKQKLADHTKRQGKRLPAMRHPQNADSVDWRNNGAVTPVKNQGQCGSCWSFSTTGSLEGAWQIAGHGLVPLSEQELVECDNSSTGEGEDSGCNGGLMDYAFQFVEKYGITSEDIYPYTSSTGSAGTCDKSKQNQPVIPVGGVSGFTDVNQGDDTALENALNVGPVSVAIEADKSAFQLYNTGVFTGDCGTQLDHGVLAVGYGVDGGQGYWWVKNSWGDGWGDQGYIKIGRGSSFGTSGQCGILLSASYPNISDNPTPTPPSPSPGPGPSPSPGPASGDYSDPGVNGESGCSAGELKVMNDLYGVDGRMCMPECPDFTCPNAPSGVSAKPSCEITKDDGSHIYCSLQCESDADCGDNMKCQNYWGVFEICVYI